MVGSTNFLANNITENGMVKCQVQRLVLHLAERGSRTVEGQNGMP